MSVQLDDGRYAAALVLAADHTDVELGKNLIAQLDYLSADKPNVEIFRMRKWLICSHNNRKNEMDLYWYFTLRFRAVKHRIEVIGRVDIAESDPKESNRYSPWPLLGTQVVYQRERDSKTV